MPRMKNPNNVYFYLTLLLSYLLFIIPLDSAYAGGVLPDTGQTKCYNRAVEIRCPAEGEPFYGQDGNYQGIQPAYQVSPDGLVVTDLITGLMWQQADDGVVRNPADASAYCEDLVLGGYMDWRLPSRQELVSIIDYGRVIPPINSAFSCPDSFFPVYWSSSAVTGSPDATWCVDFYYGRSHLCSNTFNPGGYTRCVRGGS